MSLTLQPIQTVSIVEPTLQMRSQKYYGVFKGGSDNTYYNYAANSFSSSQAVWNLNTPGEDKFIDRKVYIQTPMRFTFNGTTPDVSIPLIVPGFDSLRAYPIANSMSTATVQINSGASTVNIADVIQPMMRYTSMKEQYYELSNSPNYLDQAQTYEELIGSMRNPLNAYHDSIDGAFNPRGCFPYTIVSNTGGPNAQAIIDVDIVEPLMVSPLHFNSSLANGFIGIKQMSVQIVWTANMLTKMWSHFEDPSTPRVIDVNSSSVAFIQAPQLLMRVINPSEINSLSIPETTLYPYHQINRYITDKGGLAKDAPAVTQSINSIQLSVVPRRMFIYVKRSTSEDAIDKPDSYLAIEGISINFGNRSGILSSATKRDLYNISKKNGVNMTWAQWSAEKMIGLNGEYFNGVGSVLCLMIPEDIALTNSDMLAPGVSEKINLQMNVTYRNYGPSVDAVQMYIIVDNEGVFTNTQGLGIAQIGILSKDDVLNAEAIEGVNYEDVLDVYGGDFFGDIGAFIKKIPQGLKNISQFTQENILPIAKAVAPLLSGLGSGGKFLDSKQPVMGNKSGGLIVGGKTYSKSDLRRRLRK